MTARTGRCWPGRKRKASRCAAGTASTTEMASGVSRLTPTISSASYSCIAGRSEALEIVEGFRAGLAAPQRLACGRAELGDSRGVRGPAFGAFHRLLMKQGTRGGTALWRSDPKLA